MNEAVRGNLPRARADVFAEPLIWDNNPEMIAAARRIAENSRGVLELTTPQGLETMRAGLKEYLEAVRPGDLPNINGCIGGYVESAYGDQTSISLRTKRPVVLHLDKLPTHLSFQRLDAGDDGITNWAGQIIPAELTFGQMVDKMAIIEGTTNIRIGKVDAKSRISVWHNSAVDVGILEGRVTMGAFAAFYNPSVFIGKAVKDTPGPNRDHWKGRVEMPTGEGIAVFNNRSDYVSKIDINYGTLWNDHDPNYFAMPSSFKRADVERLEKYKYQEVTVPAGEEGKPHILLPDNADRLPYRAFTIVDPKTNEKRYFVIVRLENLEKERIVRNPRIGYALFETDTTGKSKFHFAFRGGRDQYDRRTDQNVVSEFDVPGRGRTGESITGDGNHGQIPPARDLPFTVGTDTRGSRGRDHLYFEQEEVTGTRK